MERSASDWPAQRRIKRRRAAIVTVTDVLGINQRIELRGSAGEAAFY